MTQLTISASASLPGGEVASASVTVDVTDAGTVITQLGAGATTDQPALQPGAQE